LAEKQAMLESFIEHNPYSLQIFDEEGRPLRSNKAHTKLFGASPLPDRIAFDEDTSIPEEVKAAIQQEWSNNRDSYRVFNDTAACKTDELIELNRLWKKGEIVRLPCFWYTQPYPIVSDALKPVCISTTGFSVKDSRGVIVNYVNMFEDITARVEAEEALRNAHQELTKAHDDLRSAYEGVEQKVVERTAELASANEKLTEANNKLQAEITERTRLQAELERQNTELEGFSHTVSHDLRNNLLVMQRLMERGNMAQQDRQKTQELLLNNTAHLQEFVE